MRHQRMLGNIGGHGKKKFLVIKSVEKMLNNDGKMVKNTRKTLRHIKQCQNIPTNLEKTLKIARKMLKDIEKNKSKPN